MGREKKSNILDEYTTRHFEEEMRRREEIQLLEGTVLSPCPWPVFVISDDKLDLETLPFGTPAGENEVDGICAGFNTYEINM